jgi:hypothetical protein
MKVLSGQSLSTWGVFLGLIGCWTFPILVLNPSLNLKIRWGIAWNFVLRLSYERPSGPQIWAVLSNGLLKTQDTDTTPGSLCTEHVYSTSPIPTMCYTTTSEGPLNPSDTICRLPNFAMSSRHDQSTLVLSDASPSHCTGSHSFAHTPHTFITLCRFFPRRFGPLDIVTVSWVWPPGSVQEHLILYSTWTLLSLILPL